MKRYCHPQRSWLAIHLSDGSSIACESILGRRKKELFSDRDIRNITYWSWSAKTNKTVGKIKQSHKERIGW